MGKRFRRKVFFTLLFSLASSFLLIIHGVFFDLDFSQIQRLSAEGFLFTFVLVSMGLFILEKIFTLEEDEEILALKHRLKRLERVL